MGAPNAFRVAGSSCALLNSDVTGEIKKTEWYFDTDNGQNLCPGVAIGVWLSTKSGIAPLCLEEFHARLKFASIQTCGFIPKQVSCVLEICTF